MQHHLISKIYISYNEQIINEGYFVINSLDELIYISYNEQIINVEDFINKYNFIYDLHFI